MGCMLPFHAVHNNTSTKIFATWRSSVHCMRGPWSMAFQAAHFLSSWTLDAWVQNPFPGLGHKVRLPFFFLPGGKQKHPLDRRAPARRLELPGAPGGAAHHARLCAGAHGAGRLRALPAGAASALSGARRTFERQTFTGRAVGTGSVTGVARGKSDSVCIAGEICFYQETSGFPSRIYSPPPERLSEQLHSAGRLSGLTFFRVGSEGTQKDNQHLQGFLHG